MSNADVVARLARACAHGTRQMQFVNELLAGEAYSKLIQMPFAGYGTTGMQYGDSHLGTKSWTSLKKRLIANGFMIKMTPFDKNQRRELELRFSV